MADDEDKSAVERAVSDFLSRNSGGVLEKSRSTLLRILRNVVSDPTSEKFRTLRTTNAVINAKVIQVVGAVGVLEAVGFEKIGEELKMNDTDVSRAALAATLLEPKDLQLALMLRHDADVRGIALSSKLVATAALDNVARQFDKRGALVRECRGHTSPARSDPGILGVRLVEDGRMFTVARDGAMIAWAADGSSCTRHVGHGDEIPGEPRLTNAQTVSCVSVDCDLVITGGWDRTCIAWDTEGSEPARRYGPFGAAVNGIAATRGSLKTTLALAACGDGSLVVFDPTVIPPEPIGSRKESYVQAVLTDAKNMPMRSVACAMSQDVPVAVSVSNDGILRLWDVNRRALLRGAQVSSSEYLFAVACDARRAYAAGDDAVVTIVSLPTLSLETRIAQPGPVWSLAVSGDDLAVGCEAPFGALLWTRDTNRVAPAIIAENMRNLCGDALARIASRGDGLPILEGQAARAQSTSGSTGADLSLGGAAASSSNFDYSFPVDLGRGQDLRIEWNKGDDPNQVAADFCARHGIPMNQIGEIVNFIQSAGGGIDNAVGHPSPQVQADMVAQVMAMGVDEQRAREALTKANWSSIEAAISFLF